MVDHAVKIFDSRHFDFLTMRALSDSRLRQHYNIHQSFQDPCQRLFNAIEPGSYIRPHRHLTDPRAELLIPVRGLMAVVLFDDNGRVINVIRMGKERSGVDSTRIVELSPATWHTVLALQSGSILLEVKAGPFDSNQPKDLASWAPAEQDSAVSTYYKNILMHIEKRNCSTYLSEGAESGS